MAEWLNLDHYDLGTFVDYVYALKQERDALRAQLPSQGGEAVEVVAYIDGGGAIYTAKLLEIMSVEPDGCEQLMTVAQHQRILAAATRPADQVADDLTMVKVSRELLERVVKADASRGASAVDLVDGWKAMQQLRALLAKSEGVKP